VYVDPPPSRAAAWQAGPMVLDIGAEAGLFAVPPRAGRGLKFGDHQASRAADPDAPRVATQAEIDAILAAAGRRIADFAEYKFRHAKVCFYDNSPDENFIAERIGAAGFLLTGFSGHGFKFGALIGEAVARTLRGERDAAWLREWAAGRAP
jgi:glycine/D-amino acid oxidase-like deaminating enzyme